MARHVDPVVKFDITLHIDPRGDHLAATVQPLGLIVFAEDIDSIVQRAHVATTMHLRAYEDRGDIFDYLKTRDIAYTVDWDQVEPEEDANIDIPDECPVEEVTAPPLISSATTQSSMHVRRELVLA